MQFFTALQARTDTAYLLAKMKQKYSYSSSTGKYVDILT